jgi:putative transposase
MLMCQVLGVSRSGYYAWRGRPASVTQTRQEQLVAAIRQIHGERHKEVYGSPRMTKELQARGVACCENTVAKVMHQSGIQAIWRRRWVRTTDSNHGLAVAENLLDRDFTPTQPNAALGRGYQVCPHPVRLVVSGHPFSRSVSFPIPYEDRICVDVGRDMDVTGCRS